MARKVTQQRSLESRTARLEARRPAQALSPARELARGKQMQYRRNKEQRNVAAEGQRWSRQTMDQRPLHKPTILMTATTRRS